MSTRRFAALTAVVIAVALLVSSAGVSTINADRGLSVAVVDDDAAFAALETHSRTLENGDTPTRVALLTVTNNFGTPARVSEISIDGGGPPAPKIEDERVTDRWLSVGATTNVTARVTCGTGVETVSVGVSVVSDSGTHVTLTRSVEVECLTPSSGGSSENVVTDAENGTEQTENPA